MSPLYWANVTVHLLAAMVWLGGMFFLALVGAPVLRGVDPPSLRARLFQRIGVRFRAVGWIAIAVLLATGVANLAFRGLLSWNALASGEFWGSRYGTTLAWKLALVAAMVGISAVHDFVEGPRAARLPPGSSEAIRARRRSAWLARINAGLGLALVYVAVRLARGG
ncbi:MAG: CopD family protein [Gemmatimonadota bacterium]|nr:CopD family protein [Gemmatimonadota bacterium]